MLFFKSYLFVLPLISAFANGAAISARKQDEATTALQLSKLKASGLLDKFGSNLDKELKGLSANKALAKIVATDSFKTLKKAADKKAGRTSKAKQSNAQQAKDTGILDKLNEWGKGKSIQSKLNKMDAKFLLVKIAQSSAFKTYEKKKKSDRKSQEDKINADIKKGKRPTIVKIVHKNKGKPTATVISIKGGPAITLAAKGTKTTFAGKGYTITPTAGSITTSKDNGASGLSSRSFFATSLALIGGLFGGAMLLL
jgi:hypothetical protein